MLALTATATRATQRSIQEVLHIPEGNVVRDSVLPANLRLRVQLVPPGPAAPAELCSGTLSELSDHMALALPHP